MRRRPLAVTLLAGLSVAVIGCSSSSPHDRGSALPKAKLEFRLVPSGVSGDPSIIPVTPTSTGPGSGRSCAAAMKDSSKKPASAGREAVLFDRKRQNCYVLGPTLLTGDHVDDASVVFDDGISQWAVDVHFSTDDFVTRVATPNVNRIVAIVLDGVVQAAPRINPGITGRDVELAGGYSRGEAIVVAASIRGVSPSEVRVAPRDY